VEPNPCRANGRVDRDHRAAVLAVPVPESWLSGEEIDWALGVMERFMRRFMGILREERPDRTWIRSWRAWPVARQYLKGVVWPNAPIAPLDPP
jgi:hypothetical protein